MHLTAIRTLPRRLHYAVCFALLVLISWALLSQNPFAAVRNTPLSWLKTVSDVVLHLGAYTVFAVACFSLIGSSGDPRVRKTVLVLLVVHAIGTEWLQGWLPFRTSDPLDAAANLCGIATGAMLATALVRVRSESRTSSSGAYFDSSSMTDVSS